MDLNEPFHIDGKAYSWLALTDYCHPAKEDDTLPGWKREVLHFIDLLLNHPDTNIEQQTSGTTGDPRKYLLNRKAMFQSARRTLDYFQLQPEDRALLCLPIRYVAGKMMVVRALLGGLDLVLVEPSSRPLQGVNNPLTFGAMVPLQVHESLHQGDDLALIEKLIIGGGEIDDPMRERLQELSKPAVYESFAMTETYTHFALRRINGPDQEPDFRLLEGVTIQLDSRGCLEVNVPGITQGTVSTNDLVVINSAGDGFQWQGRYDHVINSGGIKIIPELFEQQIRQWLGLDCLLIPETDPKLGHRLVLVVECNDDKPPLDRWMKIMRENLSGHEIPKRIVILPEIPRNASFKPDRLATGKMIL